MKHLLPKYKKAVLIITTFLILTLLKTQAQIPTRGLVAWYPFTGNALDSSGNGNNGTVNGASLTNDRFSHSKSAYHLDSTTISLANSGIFNFTKNDDFSFSIWFKTAWIYEQRFFAKRNNGYTGFEIVLVNDTIRPFYGDLNNNFTWLPATHKHLTDNEWHHSVVVINRKTQLIRIYIDGEDQNMPIDISKITGEITNSAIASFGRLASNISLDDIRIYNNALDSSEVEALYLEGNNQKPKITSFTPTSTCPDSSETVFITGNNFTGASSIVIGGKPVSSFNINGMTSITAKAAPNSNGKIVVVTPNGTDTSTSSFTDNGGYTAYAYVANSQSSYLSVINAVSNKVTDTIPIEKGTTVQCVSASPDGNWVYISNYNNNDVSVINTAVDSIVATIPVGHSPNGLIVSPDGTRVYVANSFDSSVSVINTSLNSVIATIRVGNNPLGIVESPDGTKVYVTNLVDSTISVINTTTNTVVETISVGNNPEGLCISPDGLKLYVSNYSDGTVMVINTLSNTVTATIKVGNYVEGICISPDGLKVYVNVGSDSVSIINTNLGSVTKSLVVGNVPYGISISLDGSKVFVVNEEGTVSVINTNSDTIMATVRVGNVPISFGNFIANVPTACGNLVPVKIISLEALNMNNIVAINWHTSTELNTANFSIQHSTDGSSFTDIGTVKATGSGANGYSFTDTHPTNGINYYRLQSVDKDGASTYSKVVSCEWLVVSKQLAVYPNPSKSFVTVIGNHIASVQMIDNIGRVVRTVSLKDAMNPSLSVSGLQAGVYHLRVQTTDCKVSGVGFVKE